MVGSIPWIRERAQFEISIAKVLSDPLRVKILEELNKQVLSPKRFFEEFGGGSVTRVWRHFQVLLEYGWIEKVEERTGGKRRGATEHFYRAVRPAVFDNAAWAATPQSMKETFTDRIFSEMRVRIVEAMEAKTIDRNEKRHFTSTPVSLDRIGLENVLARVDALFEYVFKEQADTRDRVAEGGGEVIPMTVILAAFESPKDTFKSP